MAGWRDTETAIPGWRATEADIPAQMPDQPMGTFEIDPKGRLAAFGYGARRALGRALNTLGMHATTGLGTEADIAKSEREGRPAMAAHPWAAGAGEATIELPPAVIASEMMPAFSPVTSTAGALPRLGLPKALANMAAQVPVGAGQGALFAEPGQKGTAAATGAVLAPAIQGVTSLIGRYAANALPRARTLMARILNVNPEDAVASVGKPGEIPEAAARTIGQRGIEAGLPMPGAEPGERWALANKRLIQPHLDALNEAITGLNAKGATLDTSEIEKGLRDVLTKHFELPGTQNVGPIMQRGRQMIENLIADIKANPDLQTGAAFGNFVNLKRLLQGNWENVSEPGISEAMQMALNDASTVIRKQTEAAADKASTVLGAQFKAANKALSENIPISQGTLEKSMNVLRGETEPGAPRIASDPLNLVHRVVWGKVIHSGDPYRVQWNRFIGAAHPFGVPTTVTQAGLLRGTRNDTNAP